MTNIDMDKFRLRKFVEKLDDMGELLIHDEPIALSEISAVMESSDKAVLFKQAGPEKFELVANVNGSRKRIADVDFVRIGCGDNQRRHSSRDHLCRVSGPGQ